MSTESLHRQVDIIRVAFSYINRFKGKTFVIKTDDHLLSNSLFPLLIKDIVLLHKMGIKIVLIPGARSRIDTLLQEKKISCSWKNNIRISTEVAMPYIKMAAFDVSNRIMTFLAEHNIDAIIGNWVKARGLGIVDGVDYQATGKIDSLKTGMITRLLEDSVIPIFPNIGWSTRGKPYNISTDELACKVGKELNAAKLFFITSNPGIMTEGLILPETLDPRENGVLPQLTVSQAHTLMALNKEKKYTTEMELINLACQACEGGIPRVHIIDGRLEGTLLKEIFSDQGFGTMVYNNPYENIRPITPKDIPELLAMMEHLVAEGLLVSRTEEDIYNQLEDYVVYEVDGHLHGCGALHLYSGGKGEIAAMAVHKDYSNTGIGKKIVSYFMQKAESRGIQELFVLTTQAADWFTSWGFEKAEILDLPEEKRKNYNKKRNSQILKYNIGQAPPLLDEKEF